MGRNEPKDALVDGRCSWCANDETYRHYHDEEWGKPVSDDKHLFELIVLEGAQAGLSWLTILKRREAYRKAFHNFNPEEVAAMTDEDVDALMAHDGLIRNRRKLHSAIENAQAFLKVKEEFGSFEKYVLSFFPNGRRIINSHRHYADMPVSTPISDALSKDMKRRGFKFFGTTICYAFLQSAGFVNDHFIGCSCGCVEHEKDIYGKEMLIEKLAGRINHSDVKHLTAMAASDTNVAASLVELAFDRECRMASNALWCLTSVDKKCFARLGMSRRRLIAQAMTATHITIKRLSLNLLERMTWEKEDVDAEFLDFCIECAMSAAEKPGVRSLCIKLAFAQCRHFNELKTELAMLLESLADQPLCPAIASIRRNMLKKLAVHP